MTSRLRSSSAILAEYAQMETFFAEQFGRTARYARYYIANDPQTARQVYQAIYQVEAPANVPGLSFQGRVIEVLTWESTDGQGERRLREHEPPYLVTRYYARQAVGLDSPGPRQPAWLTSGISAYARLQYDASIGVEDYADVGARERRAARRTPLAPAGIDADNVRDDGVDSLTFLAVEWLVDQAGSDAIAYYHRLLSSSSDSSWAFETAFGMSVGGFHEPFEAYRAEHFPPDAHLLADNVPGATFVFFGDVPATTRGALEAEHEACARSWPSASGPDCRAIPCTRARIGPPCAKPSPLAQARAVWGSSRATRSSPSTGAGASRSTSSRSSH